MLRTLTALVLAIAAAPALAGIPAEQEDCLGCHSDPNESFTLASGDLPVFVLHLDHPSRSLRARVLDAATGAPARPAADAFREEFLPRNATATGFFTFAWDGGVQPGNATLLPGNSIAAAPRGPKFFPVPNGTYVVEFTVLKALGDPANPAHVETWLSPSFTIARP